MVSKQVNLQVSLIQLGPTLRIVWVIMRQNINHGNGLEPPPLIHELSELASWPILSTTYKYCVSVSGTKKLEFLIK